MTGFGVFLGFSLMLFFFFYGGATGDIIIWWPMAVLAALATSMAGGPEI